MHHFDAEAGRSPFSKKKISDVISTGHCRMFLGVANRWRGPGHPSPLPGSATVTGKK